MTYGEWAAIAVAIIGAGVSFWNGYWSHDSSAASALINFIAPLRNELAEVRKELDEEKKHGRERDTEILSLRAQNGAQAYEIGDLKEKIRRLTAQLESLNQTPVVKLESKP